MGTSIPYSRGVLASVLHLVVIINHTFLITPGQMAGAINTSLLAGTLFTHLNLTLDQPLVDKPTPYFPCNTASNGRYALGRAFLQDAFFGANLQTAVCFLSQAPGPNLNSENVMAMDSNCRTLEVSKNDWVTSWNGRWTPLPEPNSNTSSGVLTYSKPAPGHGFMAGVIAGATVGGVVGLMLLSFVSFIIWRYRKHGKGFSLCGLSLVKYKSTVHNTVNVVDARKFKPPVGYSQHTPYKLAPTTWQLPANITDRAAEMDTPHIVYEMSANHIGHHGHCYTNT
ncbi:hypothetical protein F4813DRAFT_276906 [Daldinia decipiens]|uniref:uncharacterized protein n=1 Tax=Daldinia decipiens TaxID=326647 RepID=UPI0020C496E6|nr:uncharacterized protein F4813DRAFT_276906 [Daldinia decipiens]KAI1653225.1 hypothetical protein F4813DRAFT_276906 [Daldinia decipiens]